MSYNWIDAATPQGRERLKELMDKGETLAMREDDAFGGKRIIEGIKIDRTYYLGKRGVPSSLWEKWDLSGVEFLDPEPKQDAALLTTIEQIQHANKKHNWPYHDAHQMAEDIKAMMTEIDKAIDAAKRPLKWHRL